MATTITQTLFIGLGGTGARALLRAKHCFIEAYGEVPPMIEFLAIDTDGQNIGGNPIQSHKYGDITLSQNETLYCTDTTAIGKYQNFPSEYTWLPTQNVNCLKQIRGTGAGMVRSNGRFIAQSNFNSILTSIQGKVSNILAASSNPKSKYQLAKKADGTLCPAIVNVVGSIAGGTGSGMIIDVLDIVSQALASTSFDYYLYPWILMPDVYRLSLPKMTDSVHSNAFGALRELDYLFSLPLSNKNPLDFGNGRKVYHMDDRISYAYIINNFNSFAGTIKSADDMADVIGRSMFLPTNDMGNAVATPMDNIRNWMPEFTVKAQGKTAWCTSMGSSELVYDSQEVGDCIGYSLIKSVANQLCQVKADMQREALAWMSMPGVEIQEHDADQLIDTLLNPVCPYEITIDKETTLANIEAFIGNATNVKDDLQQKHNAVKTRVKSELSKKIDSLLNDANGIGQTEKFLTELHTAIDVCVKEMYEEQDEHKEHNKNHEPWEEALKRVPGRFFGTNKEEAELLASAVKYHIEETREFLRKQYAVAVYEELGAVIKGWLDKILVLKEKLGKLEKLMSAWKLSKESAAMSLSPFRVNLHVDDVKENRKPNEDDSRLFVQQVSVSSLFNAKDEYALFDMIKPWADEHTEVKTAFAVGVEDKLRSMNQADAVELFKQLKSRASSMWAVDYQGKIMSPKPVIDIFVVGCKDGMSNIIKNDVTYSNIFKSTDGSVSPSFVSTYQKDRIQFLTLSCCAPVYAVKNTMTYEKEYNERNDFQAGYLDQNWNQRMISEKFQLTPQKKNDGPDPLEIWVKSYALGFVKFDNGQYWVKSKKNGIALKGYRKDLGTTREVAYQAYLNMGIDKELFAEINNLVATQGKAEIQGKFDAVSEDNYLNTYSMISDEDMRHLDDPTHYQQLIDLMTNEMDFVANTGLKV